MTELNLSAQVSVYPLRQAELGPAVDVIRRVLEEAGLEPEVGAMSTLVVGEASALFAALERGMREACELGGVVMSVTLSNACPT